MALALSLDATSVPCFLVCDVHAGAFGPDRDRELLDRFSLLLDLVQAKGGRLLVLGDLFDYWQHSGKRYPNEFRPWLERLERHHRSAAPTVLLTGNHDHWAGGPLKDAGLHIVADHIAVAAGTGVFILLHGDGLPGPGLSLTRKGLNARFRHPFNNRLFALLPLGTRIRWMRSFSNKRRQRSHDPDEAARTENHMADWLRGSDYAGLVFGHTHRQSFRNIGRQIVVNLGTFYGDEYVGILTGNGFNLNQLHQLTATDGPR